jgi:annexin A7/11
MGDWERCLLTRVYTRAQYQAVRLHAAFDQWGTDDAMTCRILGRNSKAMLQKVSEEYEKMYSKSLENAIKSECSGKYKKALLQSLFNTAPGQDED